METVLSLQLNERRRTEAYKLRLYIDLIKETKAMTIDAWIASQVNSNQPYMSKEQWISYLQECANSEALKLASVVLAA